MPASVTFGPNLFLQTFSLLAALLLVVARSCRCQSVSNCEINTRILILIIHTLYASPLPPLGRPHNLHAYRSRKYHFFLNYPLLRRSQKATYYLMWAQEGHKTIIRWSFLHSYCPAVIKQFFKPHTALHK